MVLRDQKTKKSLFEIILLFEVMLFIAIEIILFEFCYDGIGRSVFFHAKLATDYYQLSMQMISIFSN